MRAAALLALASLVLAGSALAGSARRPVLELAGSPLAVHGHGFRANERVVLFITATTFSKRAVLTDAEGRFRVALPSTATRCGSLMVQARGAHGERASVGIATTECGGIGAAAPKAPGA